MDSRRSFGAHRHADRAAFELAEFARSLEVDLGRLGAWRRCRSRATAPHRGPAEFRPAFSPMRQTAAGRQCGIGGASGAGRPRRCAAVGFSRAKATSRCRKPPRVLETLFCEYSNRGVVVPCAQRALRPATKRMKSPSTWLRARADVGSQVAQARGGAEVRVVRMGRAQRHVGVVDGAAGIAGRAADARRACPTSRTCSGIGSARHRARVCALICLAARREEVDRLGCGLHLPVAAAARRSGSRRPGRPGDSRRPTACAGAGEGAGETGAGRAVVRL